MIHTDGRPTIANAGARGKVPTAQAKARQVLIDVIAERERQEAKWGDQSRLPDMTWLAILMEEVGESATDILEGPARLNGVARLRAELIQVAAVAVAWVEAIDRRA